MIVEHTQKEQMRQRIIKSHQLTNETEAKLSPKKNEMKIYKT